MRPFTTASRIATFLSLMSGIVSAFLRVQNLPRSPLAYATAAVGALAEAPRQATEAGPDGVDVEDVEDDRSSSSASSSPAEAGAEGDTLEATSGATPQQADVVQPKVKWNQKSDSLHITILTHGCGDHVDASSTSYAAADAAPIITATRIKYSCTRSSDGKKYVTDLRLLRPINPDTARVVKHGNQVTINLDKQRKEPCWKFLLKARKTFPSWLQKDFDQLYADDCQLHKELWRETYFKWKYKKDVKLQDTGRADADGARIDLDQQVKFATWEKAIQKMRERALPYDEVIPFKV